MSKPSRKSIQALLSSLAVATAGSLVALPSSFAAPTGAPDPNDIPDTTTILEMGASPEEKMIYGELPTPETGLENPEDLLTSSPLAQPAKKGEKSASAKGAADGMPKKLREVPTSKKAAAPRTEDLPPPPPPPAETVLAPEVPIEPEVLPAEEAPLTAELPPDEPLPEAPAEPVAEVEEPVFAERAEGTSTQKWDRTTPMYDRENPNWAVSFHGSLKALGSTGVATEDPTSGTITSYDVRNFGFGFEWEPSALQAAGVFSVGATGGLYVLSHATEARDPEGPLTSNAFSIFSLGVNAKYQFRYFRGQPLVPFVGFEAQQIRYRFASYSEIGSGWTLATGPTFGAMLLLNWMEPSAAHSLWADTGIKRSYLVGEMKLLKAGEPVLSVEGTALYFGLRMEY